MKQNSNFFSPTSNINNTGYFPSNFNYNQNQNDINIFPYYSLFSSFTNKVPQSTKKRSYNELIESYKENHNNFYQKENNNFYEAINMNFKKNINQLKPNFPNNNIKEKLINEKKKKIKNIETKLQKKKFVIDDDIDNLEKDFTLEKEKKFDKKYKLSKSYLYEEDPESNSDLDDTKENSFSPLNISVDYPEINMNKTIKDKLITNAIELEKTFNRFFDVKTIPNKK